MEEGISRPFFAVEFQVSRYPTTAKKRKTAAAVGEAAEAAGGPFWRSNIQGR